MASELKHNTIKQETQAKKVSKVFPSVPDNILFLDSVQRGSPRPRPVQRRACPRQVSPLPCSLLPGRPPPSSWSWRWGSSTGSEERGGKWEEGLPPGPKAGRLGSQPANSSAQLPGRAVLAQVSSQNTWYLLTAGTGETKAHRDRKHLQSLKHYKIIYPGDSQLSL